MAFIAINDVLDRLVRISHSRDHLFAFGCDDTGIVDSMRDQKRRSDFFNMKQGRA